ncbi:MAG: hypothetical protein IPJ81_04680 [Chitinophagaceae bacterium]|nr:hypothetical protein [Chitinophagaceae bacterium]
MSCTEEKNNIETNILDKSFLVIVDTIAYSKLSLRPAFSFNDNINNPDTINGRKLIIKVSDTLQSLSKWKKEIAGFFKENNSDGSLKDFEKLIQSRLDSGIAYFDIINNLKSTGSYSIKTSDSLSKNDLAVGKVEFSRVAYNEDIAALVVKIEGQNSKKAGIVKLVLLKRNNNVWEKFREASLEIW